MMRQNGSPGGLSADEAVPGSSHASASAGIEPSAPDSGRSGQTEHRPGTEWTMAQYRCQ